LINCTNTDALKDPFTGKLGVHILEKISLKSKVNQLAQDLQAAFMITKHLFLPVVESSKGDIYYLMMKIFKHCHTRKNLIQFCHHILSLVHRFRKR
jgi:hypothetical protein